MAQFLVGTVPTVTNSPIKSLYVVKPNLRTMLITDGVNGLWEWDCSSTGLGLNHRLERVIDYLPTVNSNSGSAGQTATWCYTNTKAPCGHYMTWYKGRVFFADPNTSKVFYSGTRLDYTVGIADKGQYNWNSTSVYRLGDEVVESSTRYICLVNHTAGTFATDLAAGKWSTTRPMKPWENWNVRMDLSRTNPANGGSIVVGDTNERLNGLWATESGLLVFKERSIYLWSWSDAAAPHEVDRGASITRISDGVGLVSYGTIDQHSGTVIFFGQDSNSNYGVFTITDNTVTNVSGVMRKEFSKLQRHRYDKPQAQGIVFDGWYYLAPQGVYGGDTIPLLSFAMDLSGGGWVGLSGVPLSMMSVFKPEGKLTIVNPTDGKTYRYPNPGVHTDFGAHGIDWKVKSAKVDAEDPYADKKFRIAWIDADSLTGDTLSNEEVDYTMLVEYNDGFEEHSGTIVRNDTDPIVLDKRAQDATISVYGTSTTGLRIRDIGIGWRDRKRKNVQD